MYLISRRIQQPIQKLHHNFVFIRIVLIKKKQYKMKMALVTVVRNNEGKYGFEVSLIFRIGG